jgi:hypothetical protein
MKTIQFYDMKWREKNYIQPPYLYPKEWTVEVSDSFDPYSQGEKLIKDRWGDDFWSCNVRTIREPQKYDGLMYDNSGSMYNPCGEMANSLQPFSVPAAAKLIPATVSC